MGNTVEPDEVYELPAHWVGLIINGDASGLSEHEHAVALAELDNIYDAGHVLVDVIGEPFFMTHCPAVRQAWKRWAGSDKVGSGMLYEYGAINHREV